MLTALAVTASPAADTPSVVLIMADDLSSDYLSVYDRDGVPTPNLERMADEGIKFVNYMSPSICGPARSALVTSRTPRHSNTYHNYLDHRGYDQDVNRFLTLAQMFELQGYATCFTGKWNTPGKMLHYDTALVWEHDARTDCAMEDASTASRYWYPALSDEAGNRVAAAATSFGPDLFAAHGLAFLREKLDKDEPFLWHYAMVEPHGIRGNRSPDVPGTVSLNDAQRYRSLLAYMDKRVGAVLDAVAGTNTIVIFVADNPTATEGKSWATPKGMFVPCLVWGAGIARRGHSKEMLTVHDLMPTLGQAIGAPAFYSAGRAHYDYWTGAAPVTAGKKMSYIGASQIWATRKLYFVRDAVRGNADGTLTRGRTSNEKRGDAIKRRASRSLTRWCGPMLREGVGMLRRNSFAAKWIKVEKRER